MSYTDDIRKLLDIQDKQIIFEEKCIKDTFYRLKKAKFIEGTLTYTPSCCEKCGVINKDYTVYKNGTQTSIITIPMSGVTPTYLKLRKQRFRCKACGTSFTAQTSLVDKHCFIANVVKAFILIKTQDARTISDIAKESHVSWASVQRVINEQINRHPTIHLTLPEHLAFDEFKYAKGRMAFEYINNDTGEILDILSRRDSRTVKDHFRNRYSLKERRKVKTITVDMNTGYISMIQALFPKASVIIDRFHLVQLINRAMNKTRIAVMNQLSRSPIDQKKYRRMKRYWRLFLKKEATLAYTAYRYYPMFGQRTEAGILQEMLDYHQVLKDNYQIYQAFLEAITHNDLTGLQTSLQAARSTHLSPYMRTSMKTLLKHLPHIAQTFKYPFNNGRIEGINHKIKVLTNLAYGYRNFMNLKSRIMLHFNQRIIEPATQHQPLATA